MSSIEENTHDHFTGSSRVPLPWLSPSLLRPASTDTERQVHARFAIQGQQSPFVLAAEGGHFTRAGVNVQVDRGYGSADAITKVASGAYDMAFADIGALIQFNGRQAGAKVVSVFQVYDAAPMLILSLKKSNITKPSDLAGKRLASPPGASSA